MPTAHHEPMTRARARQLNYQVKSFLAVHTNLSQNGMLLNYGDECLIFRDIGYQEEGRDSHNNLECAQASHLEMSGALT
jgi:hypothetical protein